MKRPVKDIKVALWFLLVTILLAGTIWWAYYRYITSPPYVDPARFPVRGIDISYHNDYSNLDAAAGAGYEFVWMKASEGGDWRDPNFEQNYRKAKHAGLKVGVYHYFRFDRDGIEQAMNLLNTIGRRPLDMGIAIDVEESGNAKGVPLDTIKSRLQMMVEYLNMRGHRVIFYSNRQGKEKYLMPEFEGFPLWICSFTNGNADEEDWTFWQYDHHGRVSGVRGEVDLNAFSGTREEWEKWLNDNKGP